MPTDQELMFLALELAEQAGDLGEAPVGAIVVDSGGEIIGRGHNLREVRQSPTAHAEILAIEAAAAVRGSWKLDDCTIYVTLEPCLMCAGAIMQARLKRIVFGAFADKSGALSSVANVYEHRFGYSPMVRGGILESECAELMNGFGKNLRET
jgi:tRNA(adenine34) deaminase